LKVQNKRTAGSGYLKIFKTKELPVLGFLFKFQNNITGSSGLLKIFNIKELLGFRFFLILNQNKIK
jgi:hypothetical protein